MPVVMQSSREADKPLAAPNRDQLLEYIAAMSAELQALAERAECATLAGLLALVRAEAETRAGDR